MSIRHLAMISQEFPSPGDPVYSFVEQLACAFAQAGVRVSVIAPANLTRMLAQRRKIPPELTRRDVPGGGSLSVYRPRGATFSNRRMGFIDFPTLNYALFTRAVQRALSQLEDRPDALYGHFVAMSGMCAADMGEKFGIPAFMAYGESSPKMYSVYPDALLREKLRRLRGVISVSSQNKLTLLERGLIADADAIGVFPNGIDPKRFYPMDRAQARRTLGLEQGRFIVAFVGALIERKGVGVLSQALKAAGDVQSIFIGRGPLAPDCPGIVHLGPMDNARIPLYLNAADAFVLPTLAEGCCNAIVEALGCGLPVISSDLTFNDDILDESCSIRVDPRDAQAVARAIMRLRDDAALRGRLAGGARARARELTLYARSQKILEFISSRL